MRANFCSDSVTLTLDPAEFGFIFRAVNDRIHSLPPDEVSPRLGLSYESAKALLDALLVAETQARNDGEHWLPPGRAE